MKPRSTLPPVTILLFFFASGATGLLYEVLWLRQLVLIFGTTLFATSAILSTFMGGLALGAFAAGRSFRPNGPKPLFPTVFSRSESGRTRSRSRCCSTALPSASPGVEAGGRDSFLLMSLVSSPGSPSCCCLRPR